MADSISYPTPLIPQKSDVKFTWLIRLGFRETASIAVGFIPFKLRLDNSSMIAYINNDHLNPFGVIHGYENNYYGIRSIEYIKTFYNIELEI